MSTEKIFNDKCFSFESKYLNFVPSNSHNPATWKVDVLTSDGILLGQVRYFGNWRQYGFFPNEGTVFEKTCLNDITKFVILMNDLQKKGIKPTNPQTKLIISDNAFTKLPYTVKLQ